MISSKAIKTIAIYRPCIGLGSYRPVPVTSHVLLQYHHDQQLRCQSSRPSMHHDENDATSSSSHRSNLLNSTAITDWFGQLRWKAAHMLTASLSDTERQELLHRLNVSSAAVVSDNKESNNDDIDDTERTKLSNSIAEAVAAARAQEIKLNQERWEREKEKLIRDAEIAARERIESDIMIQKRQIAFEAWKKNIADAAIAAEAEKKLKKGDSDDATVVVNPTVVQDVDKDTKVVQDEDIFPHPILGPCLLDLGYKRLHVVKASSLAAIPVWEKQRIYRHDRAKMMAADKLKTLHLGMPGVIGLYESNDGKLSILDGQHRVGMFTILEGMKKDATNQFLDQIVVEVYTKPPLTTTASDQQSPEQQDSVHAKEIFLEINKAEPVKLVDIPGIVKGSDRKILNEAVDQLHDEYHEMFSPSTNCKSPHVNLDNIRDALFAANVLSRHKIKSTKQLYDWLIQQNTILGQKYSTKNGSNDTGHHHSPKALEKSHKYKFYLGLESNWYNN